MSKVKVVPISKDDSVLFNTRIFEDVYINKFYPTVINTFKWRNLPPGVESRNIEKYLCLCGACLFTPGKTKGSFYALPAAVQGELNVYFEPQKFQLYGYEFFKRVTNGDDAVIIRNNYTYTPSFPIIQFYAKTIAEIDESIKHEIMMERSQYLMSVPDEECSLSIKNIIAKKMAGEPAVYVDPSIIDNIKIMPFPQTNNIEILTNVRRLYLSEFYEMWNVPYISFEKNERLNTDETNLIGNTERNSYLDSMIESRELARKQINTLFDLDIYFDIDYKEKKDGELYGDTEGSAGGDGERGD